MVALCGVPAVAAMFLWAGPNEAGPAPKRIYTYRQAEQARKLARRECKPLVVHFVPDSQLGAEQLEEMYDKRSGTAADLVDDVVIVVVPIEKYRKFAQRLGVNDEGGFRTVSAYDLSTMDDGAQPTCRTGFI